MDESNGKELLRWAGTLKAARSPWLPHWQDVRDYIAPTATSFTGTTTPGAKNRQKIFDNTAETASAELVTELADMLDPANLSLATEDDRLMDSEAVAVFLDGAAQRMRATYANPDLGFGSALSEVIPALVDFGTAGALWIEDRPGAPPQFSARPLAEVFCAEGASGLLDTVFRLQPMTARQAATRFAGQRLPEAVAKAAADPDRCEDSFNFWHATFPRGEYELRADATPKSKSRMPYASLWIDDVEGLVLSRGGYHERALIVARWDKGAAAEVYGRGQGMVALPDVKQLQCIEKAAARGLEKSVDPGIILPDDGVLGTFSVKPNALNYMSSEYFMSGKPPFYAMPSVANPDIGERGSEARRQRIRQAYFLHLLRMPREPRMVVTQVIEILKDKIKALGPYIRRTQDELLGPAHARTFGILLRAGAFGPVPEELAGAKLKVVYESPQAVAERLAGAHAISQALDTATPWLQQNPDLLDNVDMDGAFRDVWAAIGAPRRLLRDARKVGQLRDARNQVTEQQHQVAQADFAAGAAQKLGQAAAAFKGAGVKMPANATPAANAA